MISGASLGRVLHVYKLQSIKLKDYCNARAQHCTTRQSQEDKTVELLLMHWGRTTQITHFWWSLVVVRLQPTTTRAWCIYNKQVYVFCVQNIKGSRSGLDLLEAECCEAKVRWKGKHFERIFLAWATIKYHEKKIFKSPTFLYCLGIALTICRLSNLSIIAFRV